MGWMRFSVIGIPLLAIVACTPADYSDGINGFSQAATAAANPGQPLETAAQQADQNQMLRNLANTDPRTVLLASGCNVSAGGYHPGDCTLTVGGNRVGHVGDIPATASLTKYAAALSAVVADQTCATLQTDAKELSTAASDIATKAGAAAAAAAAGPISQIVATGGCWAVDFEQLRILRTSTAAANPSVQLVIPLIASAYNELYMDALNEAHGRAMSSLVDYEKAQASYKKTGSQSDIAKEQSSITQALSFADAIDKAKSAPPGPVILKILTLHQNLTNDLQSPTINLKRVSNDAQAFVTEAASVASAAATLTKAFSPAAAPPKVAK
jgi:hypothetical protein